MIENAPLAIATDPLSLDAGDTALSDVWSDAPMSSGTVARRLFAIKSRIGSATKYALPIEEGGAELWERLPETRAAKEIGTAALLGSTRFLLRARAEGPARNPLADSDDDDGFNSFSAQSRHTRTMYKFGY
jgi:hypothetical protein